MSDIQFLDKLITINIFGNLLITLYYANELNPFGTVYYYISDISFNLEVKNSKQKAILVSNNIDKLQGYAKGTHIQVLQFYNKQNTNTTKYTYYCN